MSNEFEKFKIILTKNKLNFEEKYCLKYGSSKDYHKFFKCYDKIIKLNKLKDLQLKYTKKK